MAEVVEPADAESVAIGYLVPLLARQQGFETVDVVGSMPAESPGYVPPREAVVIRKTGGVMTSPIVEHAQLTLTAWAGEPLEEVRAGAIARRVLALVQLAERLGFMGPVPCTWVQTISTPYNDPDPVTGRARYSFTVGVSLRGQVVRV